MNKIYNTVIIGHGIVGKRREFFLKRNKKYKIIAICDQNYDNFKIKGKIYFFKNYKDLLEHNLKIDCAFVCLSNDMAAEVTGALIKKKVNVFCEKPPSINLAQLKKIEKIKNKNKKIKLMYGFNHRFHYSIIKAKKIIDSGRFGKVLNVKATYGKSKFINFNQNDWRTKRKIAGGGILLDQGIHVVDLLLHFFGEFDEIKSFVSNNCWNFDVEDNCLVLLKKRSKNILAFIHSSASLWMHNFNIEINMQKGSLILSGILSSSKSYGKEQLIILKPIQSKNYIEPKIQKFFFKKDDSWKIEIDTFSKILDHKIAEQNSLKDAIRVMNVIENIYKNDKNWLKKIKTYNDKKI